MPSPAPELLSSEDEAGPVITPTLRGLPNYFPELPPKHTYLRTPVCHIGSYPAETDDESGITSKKGGSSFLAEEA